MRRLSPSRLLPLLVIVVAACELVPPGGYEPVLNVQGFLPAGDSRLLLVHVNRTWAIDEAPSAEFPGASVTVRRGGDTIRLGHLTRDQYWSDRPVAVRSGDVFELAVAHPGFDTVRGRTTVPDTFSITAPAAGDTVTPRDSLTWTPSPSSRGYYVSLRAAWTDTLGFGFLYPNDTLPLNIPLFILSRAPSGPWRLTIVAVDSNYYDWLRRDIGGPGGFNTSDSFPVTGGAGAFGSGVEREIEFCLRCDSAGYRPAGLNSSRMISLPLPASRPWPATYNRSPAAAIATGRPSPPRR
ncbi:MAG: DUF4249 family protein [bacterium]